MAFQFDPRAALQKIRKQACTPSKPPNVPKVEALPGQTLGSLGTLERGNPESCIFPTWTPSRNGPQLSSMTAACLALKPRQWPPKRKASLTRRRSIGQRCRPPTSAKPGAVS